MTIETITNLSPSIRAEAPASSRDSMALGLGMLGIVAFSLTLPLSRFAVAELDPWFVALGRGGVGGIAALAYLRATRAKLPTREQLRSIAFAALGVVIGFPILATWAMSRVPASHGGVVLALLPLATAIGATLIAGERLGRRFWVAGVVGSALVTSFALQQSGLAIEAGDIALVGSVILGAIGYAYSGKASRELDGSAVISWALVFCLPLTLPMAIVLFPSAPAEIGSRTWLSFGYLALVSQFLGFFPWNRALSLGGIARVGQLQLVQPFLTVAASAVLLGEAISPATLGFGAAVVGTVALGRKR